MILALLTGRPAVRIAATVRFAAGMGALLRWAVDRRGVQPKLSPMPAELRRPCWPS